MTEEAAEKKNKNSFVKSNSFMFIVISLVRCESNSDDTIFYMYVCVCVCAHCASNPPDDIMNNCDPLTNNDEDDEQEEWNEKNMILSTNRWMEYYN